MATTTVNIDTLAASGGKPQKRPTDPYIMLNEIDPDRITDIDRLKDFIYLCDRALDFIDQEELDEKLANRTPSYKKIAAAKRYRNRRQHILNKKKQAEDNRVHRVIRANMAKGRKTRTKRDKVEYHEGHSFIREPLTLLEYMHHRGDKTIMESVRRETEEWAKFMDKPKFTVTYFNKDKGKSETVGSEIFMIRKIREINEALK